jgi:hypothetical protein
MGRPEIRAQAVTTEDARNLAIIAVVAVAPLAIVFIVALLRGYEIHLTMVRNGRGGSDKP